MNQIKIRYTWKRKSDGKIDSAVYELQEIEKLKEPPRSHHEGWELVARDLWTGEKDEKGVEIFENDEIEYSYHDQWSDKRVEDSGVVEFKDGSFFPLLRNIQDIKVTGNQHTD